MNFLNIYDFKLVSITTGSGRMSRSRYQQSYRWHNGTFRIPSLFTTSALSLIFSSPRPFLLCTFFLIIDPFFGQRHLFPPRGLGSGLGPGLGPGLGWGIGLAIDFLTVAFLACRGDFLHTTPFTVRAAIRSITSLVGADKAKNSYECAGNSSPREITLTSPPPWEPLLFSCAVTSAMAWPTARGPCKHTSNLFAYGTGKQSSLFLSS